MKKKILLNFTFVMAIVLIISIPLGADVPPPPVNQLIGIYDTQLEDPTEPVCRLCHDSGVPDRHHLLVQTENRECLDCHQLVLDTDCNCFVLAPFRDCLLCHAHIPDSRPSTPHHISQDAADRHCSNCHGSVVQDFDDDHYIPDYDISEVTPDPVCKTWDGPRCVSGGCYVCHTEDPSAVPEIVGYGDLHHGARFNCMLCHQVHGNIRDCESCHGPDSLHNIQADSDNPANLGTIIPGEENLGWGHIGNGWDCFGCHESFTGSGAFTSSSSYTSSSTPQTGATIPTVTGLSTRSLIAGQETELIIDGHGFINRSGVTTFLPDVTVDNGNTPLTLQQVSLTEDQITAIIPATLSAGLYDLRVVKGDKRSSKKILTVVSPVVITEVTCSKKKRILVINGSGFSEKPEGTDDYIHVEVDGATLDIISWTDIQIKASVSRCSKHMTVNINALFGSDTWNKKKKH